MTVHEVKTELTTEAIETNTDPVRIVQLRFAPIDAGDGVVLTSADGDTFIGDVDDADEEFAYITLR